MKTKIVAGIEYQLPKATLLHATPLINAELAGRTAYSSFDKSEHKEVQEFNGAPINDVEHSNILDSLCHVYHHMSVAEHINLTYRITTSRGVLQEQARHRIQSLTVQSTRYTMSPIINAFVACIEEGGLLEFTEFLKELDFLVVEDFAANLEIKHIWDKLWLQINELGKDAFLNLALSKSALKTYNIYKDREPGVLLSAIESNKAKKNIGDNFKWVVTDNWKVNMIVTFNLRSLKNYFDLRDSGAAWFQMQELAKAMKEATPQKYLNLVIKK